VLLTAGIFFALGVGLLLSPLDLLPQRWLQLAVGVDLLLLGVSIAALDAFAEGETLLPDMARSFDGALLLSLLLGGQVALVMLLATGVTLPMLALLLGVVSTAIALQTLSDPIEAIVDRVALAAFPSVRATRAELRAANRALPRQAGQRPFAEMDDETFDRITRRALSDMGDLPRLAASPLVELPVVAARLEERGAPLDTLARAAELKAVLAESIARLKPRGDDAFGTTDAWRYYNALYFPYVAGIKPYARGYRPDGELAPAEKEALAWFRAQVPERTLYNWQTAAAKLVAQDLREQLQR
jgi:hypothetical protein